MDEELHDRIRRYARLSAADLLSAVESNRDADRQGTIELVASLAALEARHLYRGLGYASLYAYCRVHLGLSEHEAYSRMDAARAALKCPRVLDMLIAGELTTTTAALLRRWLTPENSTTLLDAARLKSKREVQAIVAKLGGPAPSDSSIYPVAGGYRFEITLDEDGYQMFRRLQDLVRHSIPSGDPAEVFRLSLTTALREVERRKLANVGRPRPEGIPNLRSRNIPARVKAKVWERDGGQCAFVGTAGRCQERGFLELHHVVPFARGGRATIDNLQLRCRAHNQYEAERDGLSRPAKDPLPATAPTPAQPAQSGSPRRRR
jgi:hypothetical protein